MLARILVLSPYEPPSDGIAKHTAHLVNAWDSAGHSVLVLAPGSKRGLDESDDIGSRSKVARIVRKIPRRRVWKRALEFEPDVVFVQFSIATFNVDLWSVANLGKRFARARVPVVIAFHESAREFDLLGPVTRLIYRTFVHITDVPVAFSSAGRDALIGSHLFGEVVEVPHGTTGEIQVTETDLQRIRDRYQIRKPLVLTLGFTDSDKGTDVLLAAANAIATRVGNDVQFLIAGSPRRRRGIFRIMERRDHRYQRRLRELASDLTHVDVGFCDYVPDEDVGSLLRLADVVALPYRRITQSGIGNLALSSRSVLVGSNLPGLKSDLGEAALYFEAGDSQEMANQIVSLLGDEHAPERDHMRELSGMRAASNTYARVAEMILSAGLAFRESHEPG
jgi:glycosyltransferase involved in cell wall biosynthesis